jgi:hypothetical protein
MSTPAQKYTPQRIAIAIGVDLPNNSIVIELPDGRDGFALEEPDMRDFARSILRACDELAERRKTRLH